MELPLKFPMGFGEHVIDSVAKPANMAEREGELMKGYGQDHLESWMQA